MNLRLSSVFPKSTPLINIRSQMIPGPLSSKSPGHLGWHWLKTPCLKSFREDKGAVTDVSGSETPYHLVAAKFGANRIIQTVNKIKWDNKDVENGKTDDGQNWTEGNPLTLVQSINECTWLLMVFLVWGVAWRYSFS